MKKHFKQKRKSGFTLLEVMIALSLMTVAFAAILSSQSSSIFLTMKTKEMNTAGWLAARLMTESEHLLENKPLNELKQEETGTFEAPFERYKWKREVREVKFPDLNPQSENPNDQQAKTDQTRIFMQAVSKYLNDTMRELVITVTWTRGTGEQNITVSTYLVDLKQEFNLGI